MPKFLNTLGRSVLGVAICDRCKFKAPTEELVPDPNIPGLRVHKHCADQFDPYRLPAIQDDRINLPFVRPDLPLDGTADVFVIPNQFITQNGFDLVAENGESLQAET